MLIFSARKVWIFLKKIQLTKFKLKRSRGAKYPPLCQLGLNSWELLEPEARLFFRQFVIIDGDESLLICHGLKRVDRCSFDHEGRPA